MSTENDINTGIKRCRSAQKTTLVIGAAAVGTACLLPISAMVMGALIGGITLLTTDQYTKQQGMKSAYKKLKEHYNNPDAVKNMTGRLNTLKRRMKIAAKVENTGIGLVAGGVSTGIAAMGIPALGFLAAASSPLLVAGFLPFMAGGIYKVQCKKEQEILDFALVDKRRETAQKPATQKPSTGLRQKSVDNAFNPKASPEQDNTPKTKQDVKPAADKARKQKK